MLMKLPAGSGLLAIAMIVLSATVRVAGEVELKR
jgi:hypothetical protein